MNTRKMIIRAVWVLIGLPVTLLLTAVVWFYASFYALHRADGTIVSSGQEREYLLHVPPSYDRARPTPLVISLHAAAVWPATQMEITQWNKMADAHGFIVVYPSGTTLRGTGTGVLPRVWRINPDADLLANVRFISELIDRMKAAYNIDETRVYVNGFSNGAAMAFALSCTLSDRIAAVGTVSAAQDQRPWSWCADSRPVALINFHGTADFVPYNGGKVWMSPVAFPSVPTWTANWARRNRCGPNPAESVVTADVGRLEYTNCAEDATVVLYTISGGGHSWPGGKAMPRWIAGPTSRSIDATSQMWAFFCQHQRLKH